MSFIRYYIGKLNLSPRWDSRCEDVLSAALSVYKIKSANGSHGRNYFYIVFSASDFRYILDVTRVFRANGILGTLCYTHINGKDNKPQNMMALRVRDRNQKFIHDVQKTIEDVTYFRDTVLPEYNTTHKNKKYIFNELFGRFK